jgi:hypothetical protein
MALTVRALRGWIARDTKAIEELRRLIPPFKAVRIVLTFSVETGRGHDPFYAEVTAESLVDVAVPYAMRRAMVLRIVNASLKLFWILFDSDKAIAKDKRAAWGDELYDRLDKVRSLYKYYVALPVEPEDIGRMREILDRHPYIALEEVMDRFIKALIRLGCFEERSPDEFVTRQAILKIGVEYHYAMELEEPRYPLAYLLIEKGISPEAKDEWVLLAKLQLADRTDLDMLDLLGMETE